MANRFDFCPNSNCEFHKQTGFHYFRKGSFLVKHSQSRIKRYQCSHCKKTFSSKTFAPDSYQKKPFLNLTLSKLLCEGSSIRAASRIIGMTYYNTYKKFLWLKSQAQIQKKDLIFKARVLYFDEMETIHHTKCKPLSIALFVNEEYQILDAQVAEIPAKGRLAAISRKKYGERPNNSESALKNGFENIAGHLSSELKEVFSDAKSSYKKFVIEHFPNAQYETHSRADKDRHRDRLHEKLQKNSYDPLFPINQRCAKLRSDIKRLTRRSWCTTKKIENLQGHLDLYIVNQFN